MLGYSPYDPYAAAELVEHDWKFAQQRLQDWEKKFGQMPSFISALAAQYAKIADPKAEEWLRKAVEYLPNDSNFKLLAKFYRDKGDLELWRKTLDEFLSEVPSTGLEHAAVRISIARHFMIQQKWSEAEPYAAAASQTGASWAMSCASQCYEGMRDWEKAELWIRRSAERYESQRATWFLFCERTGQGDRNAAKQLALNYFNSVETDLNAGEFGVMGIIHLLEREPKQALVAFRHAYRKVNNPYNALHVALLTDELGDSAARDAAYRESAQNSLERDSQGQPYMHDRAIARLFVKSLQSDSGQTSKDLRQVDGLLADTKLNAGTRTNLEYFVGRFLLHRGDAKSALKYIRRCVNGGQKDKWNYLLAKQLLNELEQDNSAKGSAKAK